MLRKIVKLLNKLVDHSILLVLVAILLYGIYGIIDIYEVYDNAKIDESIIRLKPNGKNNRECIKQLKKFNGDIFAWIQIDNTSIDYPIVQGKDNMEYLKKDYHGEYSSSGAIFLDYRNKKNFTDFYNIIYGHHMNRSLMFGDLDEYKNKSFFDKNKTGKLYLKDGTYDLEIFACAQVSSYNSNIYTLKKTKNDKLNFIEYIRKNAKYYRNVELDENSNIIALSTCSRDTTNGRFIIFTKIIDKQTEDEKDKNTDDKINKNTNDKKEEKTKEK